MSTSLLVASREYIDIDIAFSKHPSSKNLLLKKNVNAVKQSVLHLMRLRSGDVPFHPEMKSPVYDYMFDNMTNVAKIIIESEVKKYLGIFEPRLQIQEVVVDFIDDNSIDCKIIGNIVNVSAPVTISVLVNKLR